MAVDTEDKRRSASSITLPIAIYFVADGMITQADRRHTTFIYRGILAITGKVIQITAILAKELYPIVIDVK